MQRHSTSQQRFLVGILGLLLCAGWATLIFRAYRSVENEQRMRQLDLFTKATSVLEEKIHSYVNGLQGMGGLIHAHQTLPRESDIRRYAEFRQFFDNFHGSLGFGFIRRVSDKELATFIRRKREEAASFRVREFQSHPGDHLIIETIEPLENNRPARGLDIASERSRRLAAWQSAESGLPTITAPVTLVQAESKGVGFLYYLPIYREHRTPETLELRRKSLVGFAYTPILAKAIQEHLVERSSSTLGFVIDDVTDERSPQPIVGDPAVLSGTFVFDRTLEVGQRRWRLRGSSLKETILDQARLILSIGLILGLGVILLLIRWLFRSLKETRSVETWQRAALAGTDYSMIATDPQGVVTIFNAAAERMLGYSADEMIGKVEPGKLHDPEEIKRRTEILREELGVDITPGFETFVIKSRLTKAPDRNEWTYIRKDGSRLPVMISVTTIFDDDGNVQGYLGVGEDITELKRLEAQIEAQKVSMIAGAKLSALGEMAGGIAHEINNPLAIIAGQITIMSELQKSGELTEPNLDKGFKKIEATVERIVKIIRGLRTFSRDSSADPAVSVPVSKIVEETLGLCQERFRKNGIDLRLKGDLSAKVHCRPVEVSQVLMNLFLNSFDAVHTTSEKWVEVGVENSQELLDIVVTDSGTGIAPEDQTRIFEPFFTTKDVGKGTGLGLSIARGIMNAHGAEILLDSRHPHTRFTLRFYHARTRRT